MDGAGDHAGGPASCTPTRPTILGRGARSVGRAGSYRASPAKASRAASGSDVTAGSSSGPTLGSTASVACPSATSGAATSTRPSPASPQASSPSTRSNGSVRRSKQRRASQSREWRRYRHWQGTPPEPPGVVQCKDAGERAVHDRRPGRVVSSIAGCVGEVLAVSRQVLLHDLPKAQTHVVGHVCRHGGQSLEEACGVDRAGFGARKSKVSHEASGFDGLNRAGFPGGSHS